jgi:predicted aspartyl protease
VAQTAKRLIAGTLACSLVTTAAIASDRLPFTRVGNLVIVEATVNGSRPLRFVLDTGAARMLIDAAVARELNLPEGESDTIGGAGAGRVPVKKIAGVQMAIGPLKPQTYDFAASDLSGVSSLIGEHIDGIIGYAFLRQFIVTIDYRASMLELRNPNDTLAAAGEQLPIRIENGWAFVRATLCIDDAHIVTDEFLIDSGSDDDVDHPLAREASNARHTQTGNGLGQPVPGAVATARWLQLGSMKLRDLNLASGGASDRTSKLIGGGVLSGFIVTFDYPHSRMFLKQ